MFRSFVCASRPLLLSSPPVSPPIPWFVGSGEASDGLLRAERKAVVGFHRELGGLDSALPDGGLH